ncbi:hypothetical protein LguiB_002815 [Lonicera macranthoides]
MASPGDPPLFSLTDPAVTSPLNPVDPTLTSPNTIFVLNSRLRQRTEQGITLHNHSMSATNTFIFLTLLPVLESDTPVVLWCANRDNPVRGNATLQFTAKSGLALKDVDACGSYGVCSDGNSSYLKQSLDWQPTIGCTPITPSSCNDKHLHSFLELKKVTYFHLKPLHSTKDKESYKRACLDNCTCKAAFFSWQLFFTITTLLVEIRH